MGRGQAWPCGPVPSRRDFKALGGGPTAGVEHGDEGARSVGEAGSSPKRFREGAFRLGQGAKQVGQGRVNAAEDHRAHRVHAAGTSGRIELCWPYLL